MVDEVVVMSMDMEGLYMGGYFWKRLVRRCVGNGRKRD